MDFFHFFVVDLSQRSIRDVIKGLISMIQTLKKGDRVITTGQGRTKKWGNVFGIVPQIRGDKVFISP